MSTQRNFPGLYDYGEIYLVRAVTNLHPGIGRAGDVVDLPVQKDIYGLPILYASGIKGALKSALFKEDKEKAKALFGSEPSEESFTSAVAVLDAPLLLIPVRSLEGVYAYATSPLALKRFLSYLELVGDVSEFSKIIEPLLEVTCGEAIVSGDILEVKKLGEVVINEELCLTPKKRDNVEKLAQKLNLEKDRLLVMNDDDFLRAVEKSLIKLARIRLDRDKKTVKRNALWYEEYVPWGTVFYTAFLFSKSKKPGDDMEAEKVKEEFETFLTNRKNYLILGGNETVGKGVVKFQKLGGGGSGSSTG